MVLKLGDDKALAEVVRLQGVHKDLVRLFRSTVIGHLQQRYDVQMTCARIMIGFKGQASRRLYMHVQGTANQEIHAASKSHGFT